MTQTEQIQSKLAEIKTMEEKATPGPWKHIPGDSYDAYPCVIAGNGHHFIIYDAADVDAKTAREDSKFPGSEADAAFIAASRKYIKRLVVALEHEMETSEELCERGDFDDAFKYMQKRRAELAAILKGEKP